MKQNMGYKDKAVRIVVGLLVVLWFVPQGHMWGLIGLVPIVTAGLGFCPIYPLLGMDTCKDGFEGKAKK